VPVIVVPTLTSKAVPWTLVITPVKLYVAVCAFAATDTPISVSIVSHLEIVFTVVP